MFSSYNHNSVIWLTECDPNKAPIGPNFVGRVTRSSTGIILGPIFGPRMVDWALISVHFNKIWA